MVGGFKDFKGAGILSSRASLVSGSGYTYLMTSEKKQLSKFPWIDYPDLILKAPSVSLAKKLLSNPMHSLVIGPGIGRSSSAKKLFTNLVHLQQRLGFSMVVDADAFSFFDGLKLKNKFNSNVVFTPHAGELGRVLKLSSKKVEADRGKAIMLAQKQWGGTWILKGHETLVFSSQKTKTTFCMLKNGSVALSKAGTGDVLSGIIAAFLAHGLAGEEASILGTYLHNEAAREFTKKGDVLSLSPLNLIENLPKVIKKFRQSK